MENAKDFRWTLEGVEEGSNTVAVLKGPEDQKTAEIFLKSCRAFLALFIQGLRYDVDISDDMDHALKALELPALVGEVRDAVDKALLDAGGNAADSAV